MKLPINMLSLMVMANQVLLVSFYKTTSTLTSSIQGTYSINNNKYLSMVINKY